MLSSRILIRSGETSSLGKTKISKNVHESVKIKIAMGAPMAGGSIK